MPRREPVAFGLDVGTSGLKGIALAADGRVVAQAERDYAFQTPRPGWSEQDPELWWQAASAVLDELRAGAGTPQGIGLSGQMHGLVVLDADREPLRPAILWNDQRTAAQCEEIESRLGRAQLVALTGNRALTGFTAPKLLWLRDHEPATYEQVTSILLPKDYVRLRLCGELACDVSDASGTLLFDVSRRTWSEEVCRALDVPLDWLPRTLESPQVSGLTPQGVPVAAGAGDQAAGALGVGVAEPDLCSVVLGTSGVVLCPLGSYAPDPEGRTHTFCHALPGAWHAMGVMLSAAGSLGWLRRATDPDGEFGALVAEGEAWPPGCEGLLFLPYLAGERTPHADPDARGAFAGLSVRHDRGALVRAVLEGVSFGLRDCLDVLLAAGARPLAARVSGGGARSRFWLQIVASALELPLTRTRVDEGAAFGAALLGGVASGLWEDAGQAISAAVVPGETIEPHPGWARLYTDSLRRYRALYPALKGAQP